MTIFIIWIIGLVILTAIHVYPKPKRTFKNVLEAFLLYLTLINVGLYSLWVAGAHLFYPDEIATQIGFGTGSPFQYEVAVAYLAFGVLGILCVWERGDFWLATIIGFSIFLFGSGLGRISEHLTHRNEATVGLTLYIDLIIPILLLVLMMVYRRLHHK